MEQRNIKPMDIQPPHVSKSRKIPGEVSVVDQGSMTQLVQSFSMDKTMIILLVVVGLSIMISYFLFRELKKTKDDIRNIMNKEIDNDDITEKVEINSKSVKAIEYKVDQLISALTRTDKSVHQAPVHQAPVHQAPVHQAPVHQAHIHQSPKVVKKVEVQPVIEHCDSNVSESDSDEDGFDDSDDDMEIPTIGGGIRGEPADIRI
jgi:hypothetical protein